MEFLAFVVLSLCAGATARPRSFRDVQSELILPDTFYNLPPRPFFFRAPRIPAPNDIFVRELPWHLNEHIPLPFFGFPAPAPVGFGIPPGLSPFAGLFGSPFSGFPSFGAPFLTGFPGLGGGWSGVSSLSDMISGFPSSAVSQGVSTYSTTNGTAVNGTNVSFVFVVPAPSNSTTPPIDPRGLLELLGLVSRAPSAGAAAPAAPSADYWYPALTPTAAPAPPAPLASPPVAAIHNEPSHPASQHPLAEFV